MYAISCYYSEEVAQMNKANDNVHTTAIDWGINQ